MCSGGRSVLLLLRRCVAVRPGPVPVPAAVPAPTGLWSRGSALSGGFIRRWSSESRTERVWGRTIRYSYCTKTDHTQTEDPYEDEYPPLPAYQADPEKKEVYIVLVKGFPWSCTAQDLLQFFSECRVRDGVGGIHMAVDGQGRPAGRAFVELQQQEDVLKALQKHRQYLGPRYVEVSEVTDSDAEALLAGGGLSGLSGPGGLGAPGGAGGAGGAVVRLRGLPFSCTQADVAHFFSGLDIVESGITILSSDRGRRSGDAFVQFSSQEAANEALKRDREVMGNRYIEVFPSSSEEVVSWRRRMSSARRPSSAPLRPRNGLQSSCQPVHQVHMRGLPFQASGEDIVKFFCPLVVEKVLIECGSDGRPSGEADVYFRSHADAVSAMSKHRQHIRERYIELFLNSGGQ